MRIASYNLRNGGNTLGDNHWTQLMREFALDVVCAQESRHPEKYFPAGEFSDFKGCVHENVPHGRWGSAILSKKHTVERLPLPALEGWVVAAKISNATIGGLVQNLIVVSVHARSPGPYESVVNSVLDHLRTVCDGTPLVIAGDFNLTTALRHPSEALKNTAGERKLIKRLFREFGVVNAWQAFRPNENLPQTLRWARNPATPYHCDAIFVSHQLLPYLVSASIKGTGHWATLSDHNPIIVTLA